MRTILIPLFLLFTSISFAQNTTQDEYNYMSKGYQHSVESGLDMKKGYLLADTMSFITQDGKYEFMFMNLLRQNNKSLAGTIVVANSKTWSRQYYLAMIAAQSDGQIDHQNTLMTQISEFGWDSSIKTGFLQALSEYLSLTMTKTYSRRLGK